jgi:hypothetical protein
MSRIPKRIRCTKCERWAKLGLTVNLQAYVRGAAVNDKTRDLFRHVFGKEKASKIKTTKDIDANFQDVAKRYPHLMPGFKRGRKYDPNSASDMRDLGNPGDVSRDPFPQERITDDGRLNAERRVM